MRRSSRPRRGVILAYLAPLLFAVFGIAALTIDLATARLTQRQMQAAVDSAALEGLRGRDDENINPTEQRQAASEMVVPSNPALAASRLGYGPVFTLIDSPLPGAKFSNALQTVRPKIDAESNPLTYQPRRFDGTLGLELNQSTNDKSGDMVAGSFKLNPDYDPNEPYDRRDFVPDAPAAPPGDAFLVRMRRSGYKPERQDGVSTVGPQLPLLLGRGSSLGGGDPSVGYSVRHHGVTVRATAIARGRPVLAVGPPVAEQPGAATFAIDLNVWQAATGSVMAGRAMGTLTLNVEGADLKIGDVVVGAFHKSAGNVIVVGTPMLRADFPLPAEPLGVYIPLRATPSSDIDPSGVPRVVGFGYGKVTQGASLVTIDKYGGRVAAINASAAVLVDTTIPEALKKWFGERVSELQADALRPHLLLAPALVR